MKVVLPAVELGGDEAGLLLHERGVVSRHLEEALGVGGRQGELVDEQDRAVVVLQLLGVGDLVVHLTQSHCSHISFRPVTRDGTSPPALFTDTSR